MSPADLPGEQPPLQPEQETSLIDREIKDAGEEVPVDFDDDAFKTLKYSLLGPSLLKAGQDKVDQTKVYILHTWVVNHN